LQSIGNRIFFRVAFNGILSASWRIVPIIYNLHNCQSLRYAQLSMGSNRLLWTGLTASRYINNRLDGDTTLMFLSRNGWLSPVAR
jgi:hypothetical protein